MTKTNLNPKKITSITFVCHRGFRFKHNELGGQEVSILLNQRKIVQRFYEFNISRENKIKEIEHSMPKELVEKLLQLFAEMDICHWESMEDWRQGNQFFWEMTIRAQDQNKIYGMGALPQNSQSIENLLKEYIEFQYPPILFQRRDLTEAEEEVLKSVPYFQELERKYYNGAMEYALELSHKFFQSFFAEEYAIQANTPEADFVLAFWTSIFLNGIFSNFCPQKNAIDFARKIPSFLENAPKIAEGKEFYLMKSALSFLMTQRQMGINEANCLFKSVKQGYQDFVQQKQN